MDTRDSLATELAQEMLDVAIEMAHQGGVEQPSGIEEFMEEAYKFVDRCIAVGKNNID